MQGEREMAQHNKSLGKFDLTDIPPAPRGMPQIEVTFDIDANGIMHVSAKDKATGKENKIEIKSSSGLDEGEIERMVREAEEHADEDREQREKIDARNAAEGLIHSVKKTVKDLGDQIDESEKSTVDSAISDLESALSGDADTAEIKAKTEALAEASHALAAKAYSQAQSDGATHGSDQQTGDSNNDDVVDADFEEVHEEQDKR